MIDRVSMHLTLLALFCGVNATAHASGFFDDASGEVLSRNFYLNNDYRSPSASGKAINKSGHKALSELSHPVSLPVRLDSASMHTLFPA